MINHSIEYPIESERKKAQKVKVISSKGEIVEEDKSYLKIWGIVPSFKDINNQLSLARGISLVSFTVAVIITAFTSGLGLTTSVVIGAFFMVSFIIIFSSHFFALRYWIQFTFRKGTSFNPFEDFIFWFDHNEPTILFRSHRKDLTHEAIQIFEVKVIPEKVHPSIHQFLIALSSQNLLIPYTFQIVQKPYITKLDSRASSISQRKSQESTLTSLYFCIFYDVKGILTNHKIEHMEYIIKQMTNDFKSNFVTNFHHYKIKLLAETDLINALRTFYFKETTSVAIKCENKKRTLSNISYLSIVKFLFFSIFISSFDIMLARYKFLLSYIFLIDCAIVIFILLVWWKEIFFGFTKNKLKNKEDIMLIKPFKDVAFLRFRKYPRTLFINVEDTLLIGLKILNLKHVYLPPYCDLKKFLEALNDQKVNYAYTLSNNPITYHEFEHEGLKFLHEHIKRQLRYGKSDNKTLECAKWLKNRYGMWYSMLTLTVSSFKFIDDLKKEDFIELEEQLEVKKNTMKGAFSSNFQNYALTELSTRSLISGYMFSVLKNKQFRISGSHLNYVMIQGTSLSSFTSIVDVLKKGIMTKIAAEFNTPLYLENFITIGHTINTEVLGKEIPAGFTQDQIGNLLITNGHYHQRERTTMKVAMELIENDKPCIVFDFNGTWSKLLSYFSDTRFENDLVFLKLGSTFTSDPLKSDIPFDTDNPKYLEYMFDAFGLAFKKDQRLLDLFRNTIRKNPEMNLPSIVLDLQTQNDWERNPLNESLIAFFSDFTPQELSALKKIEGSEDDVFHAHNFVSDEKTVILDLSLLRDANKKLFFSFLIVSKIIHYIKSTENYVKKSIFIPNTDLFFASYYLERQMDYTKVNLFLDPLIQGGFGLILTANQIQYLHPNLLTYFNNLITFKAIDVRDIAVLSNFMNLQEFVGTGMYSRTRQNAYQISYLKAMKDNNVLIKRDDIEQSFPAVIDWKEVEQAETMSLDEIIDFMDKKGYNLSKTEKRILAQARETTFEREFGRYINYLNEIMNFLDSLKDIDDIGNLFQKKLKDELLKYLYLKASKKTNKKVNIEKIRDDIFALLIQHNYLKEAHQKQASGSEVLRPSYSIGIHYQEAIDDYYESIEKKPMDVKVEIIERENLKAPDLKQVFDDQPRRYIIQDKNLKKAFAREFGELYSELFEIYYAIIKSSYIKALKIEHGLLRKFLISSYKHYSNVDEIITQNNLDKFLKYLGSIRDFPFTYEKLIDFIERYEVLNYTNDTLKELSEEIYNFQISFFAKIQIYIYPEDDTEYE